MDTYEQTVISELEKYLRAKRAEVVAKSGSMKASYKDDRSVVTELDIEIERDARKIILDLDSSVGIVGEEYGTQGSKESFWTIDPIDGTEHFIRGLDYYIFMVGFVKEGKPTASLMYNFARDEMFVATPQSGATKNGKTIRTSDRGPDRAIIEIESAPPTYSEVIKKIDQAFLSWQIPAWCAGYGFTQVASGQIEGRVQIDPYGKIFDFLPGCILVQAAGGIVKNIGSSDWDYKGLNTFASNVAVADDISNLFGDK